MDVGMIMSVSGMVVTGALPVVVPFGMSSVGAGDGRGGGQGRDGSGLVE
jgi:hypothetical protein